MFDTNTLQLTASFDWTLLRDGLKDAVAATENATAQMADHFQQLSAQCVSEAQQVSDAWAQQLAGLKGETYQKKLADLRQKASRPYDPQLKYEEQKKRIDDFSAGSLLTKNAQLFMERDNLDQLNKGMDDLLLKSRHAAAGMRVFFRQYIDSANDWAKQTYQAMSTVFRGIDGSFKTAMKDVVMGTRTLGQAFAKMGQEIVASMTEAFAQIVVQWLTANVIMRALSKLFPNELSNAKRAESATAAQSNMAQAASAAFLGAANAYAFWAWDPPTAAAVAATALATGLSYAALAGAAGLAGVASAAGGWARVPRDQFAFLHKNEMVLPSSFAGKLRNAIESMPSASPQVAAPSLGLASAGGPSITVSTSYSHNTLDPRTSRDLMEAHGDIIGEIALRKIKRWMKDNGIAPR